MTFWRSKASIPALRSRAKLFQQIRHFFDERDVWEVDTPLISSTTVSDPHIHSFQLSKNGYYLQTSPEFFMKRLVSGGSGAIYQLGKVFRDEEFGRKHNPEFTMLEWYRPQFTLIELIREVEALLTHLLGSPPCEIRTYQSLFESFCQLDPHTASIEDCAAVGKKVEGAPGIGDLDKQGWLAFIQTHLIDPFIGIEAPMVVTEFPKEQCALARLIPGKVIKAARFEVFYKGMELANGYHELNEPAEQRKRFELDNRYRINAGLPPSPIDEKLLASLPDMPDCCGVAMGVDRLLQIQLGVDNLRAVMPFTWDQI